MELWGIGLHEVAQIDPCRPEGRKNQVWIKDFRRVHAWRINGAGRHQFRGYRSHSVCREPALSAHILEHPTHLNAITPPRDRDTHAVNRPVFLLCRQNLVPDAACLEGI